MSSFIWGKPDDHTSMKYSTDQSVGFVEPASFVSTHWQYGEEAEAEGKESAVDSRDRFSNHVAPGAHDSEEADLSDSDYGEFEIIIKFKGRSGSSTRSRKFKLTSHLSNESPTVFKTEDPTDNLPQPSHHVFTSQDNQKLCLVDLEAGCVCEGFSPAIFRDMLAETLTGEGVSFDHFDRGYSSCAISDFPTDKSTAEKQRQASTSSGKKRLLSTASEDQPNKKNPRLAPPESTDAGESNDAEDGNERHTCPYFKMYPELHLECGTKDLAQRPKIKSHIIKDHLKKGGIPIPPEIRSQKCEPWDRWCKWIIQDSNKSDRPVPNSTPDFYPILNYSFRQKVCVIL